MGRDIATEVAGDGVATLALARPERRNALSIQLRDQIAAQLEQWAREPAVRVVVLSAAASSFCAGFDLAEFAPAALARRIRDSSRRYHLAVRAFPKPLLAAVNGPALAGGLDLCVLCDCRVASAGAVFGHPEIKFGAPPMFTPLQWIVGALHQWSASIISDPAFRERCLYGADLALAAIATDDARPAVLSRLAQ